MKERNVNIVVILILTLGIIIAVRNIAESISGSSGGGSTDFSTYSDGIVVVTSGAGTTYSAQTCSTGKLVSSISRTGLVTCTTDSTGSGTFTNPTGTGIMIWTSGASSIYTGQSCTTNTLVSAISATGLVTCTTDSTGVGTFTAPTGTGPMLWTGGSSSVISIGTATSSFFGLNASGVLGFYNDLLVSGSSITSTPVGSTYGGTGANASAYTGIALWSAGTHTTYGGSTCSAGSVVSAVSSTGLATCTSNSPTRTITDWRTDISLIATSASSTASTMFKVPYDVTGVIISHATDSTGTVVAGLDWKKCGLTSFATCTSMLSSASTASGTTPALSTMSSTTFGAGEYVKVLWTTITGTGTLWTAASGTASGVQ